MRTAAGARHAVVVLFLVLAGLLWTGHAEAQFFVRPVCSTMTNAQLGWTCSETSTLTLKQYNGTTWVPAGVGAGVGSINSLTGSLALVGTLNEISVVSGGTTIQLSTPQAIAPTSAVAFANVAVNAQGRLDLFNAATSLRASFQAPVLTETYTIRLPTSVSLVANGDCLVAGTFAAGVLPTTFSPCPGGGGGGGNITSIGGQAGPVITAGANDTNVTLTWAANTVSPGWAGTLAPLRGGLGGNFSAANGLVFFTAGTVTATTTIPSLTLTTSLTTPLVLGPSGTYVGTADQFRFYTRGQFSSVMTNPTIAVPNLAFENTGDAPLTAIVGSNLRMTWDAGAGAGSVGAAFLVQAYALAGSPVGAPGAISGQTRIYRDGLDAYGVLGSINNDNTVANPTGAGLWGIVRGKAGSVAVDGIRSTSESDAGTHPRAGLVVSNHLANNGFLKGVWIAGSENYGVLVGGTGGNAVPTTPFAYESLGGASLFSVTGAGKVTATSADLVGALIFTGNTFVAGPSISKSADGLLLVGGTTNGIRFNNQNNTTQLAVITNAGNVGIATAAPGAKFDTRGLAILSTNTATLPAFPGVLQVSATNGTQAAVVTDSFAEQSAFIGRRANGTPTARTPVLLDQPLAAFIGSAAFDATNYSGSAGSLGIFAAGNWAAGSTPTYATIGYTPVGSTTLAEAARFGALPGVSGTQPTLLRLGRTVTGDLTSVTVNVTAGDGPAGVAFPLYVLGKFSDFTVTPGASSTTPYAVDMVRNLVTLGGYSSPGGSVGKMIYSEYTGTMSAAHQEYYGVAALSVINPSAAACAGGCAFPNIASQAFIKHSTDAVVSAFDAQIVNRPSDGVMGTGGVYGLRIVNGNDNITTGLVTAQDALYIKAKAGSGAGVEGWANALRLHDAVGLVDRFLLGNDGTIVSRASVLPAVDGAGGSVGTASFRWLAMYGVTMRGDAFVTAGGVAGADCPAGVSGAATRVVKGIVTVC